MTLAGLIGLLCAAWTVSFCAGIPALIASERLERWVDSGRGTFLWRTPLLGLVVLAALAALLLLVSLAASVTL